MRILFIGSWPRIRTEIGMTESNRMARDKNDINNCNNYYNNDNNNTNNYNDKNKIIMKYIWWTIRINRATFHSL